MRWLRVGRALTTLVVACNSFIGAVFTWHFPSTADANLVYWYGLWMFVGSILAGASFFLEVDTIDR